MSSPSAVLALLLGLTGALLTGCDGDSDAAPSVEGLTRDNAVALVADGTSPTGEDIDGMPDDDEGRIGWLLTEVDWTESAGDDLGHGLLVATTRDADLLEATVRGLAEAAEPVVPELRSEVGAVVGASMPDVFAAFSASEPASGGDALPWLPGVQDPARRASLDEDDLRAVLLDIGADADAARAVTGAAAAYSYYGYDHYFSGAADGPVAPEDSLDDVWGRRVDQVETEVSEPYAAVVAALGEPVADALRDDGFRGGEDGSGYQAGGRLTDQLTGQAPFLGCSPAGADDLDPGASLREEVADGVAGSPGAARALTVDAVYRNLPAEVLGGSFADGSGRRIPMSEWEQVQLDAWQRVSERTGAALAATQVPLDFVDQLDEAVVS